VPGKPDFYFPRYRLAIFVDGCFWHACPNCGRIPKSNVEFWRTKIDQNRRRDNRVRRQMRRLGFHVVRVWEHEAHSNAWMGRVRRMIEKSQQVATGAAGPPSAKTARHPS
jgi:DNA mismatch endonuclease (patch repair protein)